MEGHSCLFVARLTLALLLFSLSPASTDSSQQQVNSILPPPPPPWTITATTTTSTSTNTNVNSTSYFSNANDDGKNNSHSLTESNASHRNLHPPHPPLFHLHPVSHLTSSHASIPSPSDQLHSISSNGPAVHASGSHAYDSLLLHSTYQFTNADHLVLPEDCCDGGETLMAFRLNSSLDKHHADFSFRYFVLPTQQETLSPASVHSDLSLDATSGLLSLLKPLDYERVAIYKLKVAACIFHSSSLPILHSAAAAAVSSSSSSPPSPSSSSSLSSSTSPGQVTTVPVNELNNYLKSLLVNSLTSEASSASLTSPVMMKIVSQEFTLHVKNENDEPPVIRGNFSSKFNYLKEVPENIEPDTYLLTIEASDADGDVNLSFLIPLGHPSNRYFDVNPFTGELRTKSPLDREVQERHNIPVFVFDTDNKHMTQANVLIVLSDINEFVPEFIGCSSNSSTSLMKSHFNQVTPTTPAPFFFSSNNSLASGASSSNASQVVYIPENIPKGTMFHRVIAFDKDKLPTAPEDALEVAETDAAAGSASASSSSSPSSSSSAYSNSNGPSVFGWFTTAHITTTAQSDSLRRELSYRIVYPVDTALPFTLNTSSGEIKTTSKLDRETVPQFDLLIEASDGTYTATCNLTIILEDVNDNVPVFEKPVYPALISLQGYTGLNIEKEVLTVKAIDADSSDKIYYTLNVSSTAKSDASYFNINSTSGLITANLPALISAQKLQASSLDSTLSKSSTFTFTVYAIDSSSSLTGSAGNATVHVTLTHAIESSSPKLKQYPYVIELNGHRSDFRIGSQVGTIEFASLGSSSSIRIQVEDSHSSYKCSDYFNIDSKTGSVTVKRNLVSNFYECYLNIAGGGDDDVPETSSLLQLFFLKGIANKSKAKKANAFTLDVDVSEVTPVGSQVINLITRSRMPSLKSDTSEYVFTIAYSSLDASYFDLNSKTGVLYLKKALDHEILPDKINLAIVAKKTSNPFENPIYFNLVITVVNVNDNPPKFTQDHYMANVYESGPRGTFVASVFALDLDTLVPSSTTSAFSSIDFPTYNGNVKYAIEDGNLDNAFIIDSSTGIIKTNSVLDREIRSHYSLRISATDSPIVSTSNSAMIQDDSSNGRFTSWCTLEINVMDIDDNVPVLPPSYELSVKEDSKVGSVVTTLTANDVDTWPKITYRLANDSINTPFDIDLYTGRLFLTSPLSTGKLLHKIYILHVHASDSMHQIETEVMIKVKKGDVFTSSPPLAKDFQFVSVDPIENSCIASGGVNCQIARVVEATPATSGSSSHHSLERSFRVLYKMESDPSSSFYIDSSSGVIYNNRSLKLPSNKLFALQVMAGYSRDGVRYLNHLRSRSALLISVQKSDFVEEFSENEVNVINVDTSIESIGSVLVSLPLSKKYTYKITNVALNGGSSNSNNNNNNNNGNLLVNHETSSSTSGDGKSQESNFLLLRNNQLSLMKPQSPGSYKVEIEGWPKKSPATMVKFIVNVKIVSDGKVTLTPKVYHVKLPEDSPIGHDVISLTSDLEYSQPLKYIITSGNEKGDFKINDLTGLVTQEARLSYDRCNYYQLTLSVRRRSDSSELSLILLNIQIQRVIHDASLFNAKYPPITSHHFAKPTIKASIKENMPIGSNVVRLPDHSQSHRYTLSPTSGPVPFELDQLTGYIVTTQVIDYETADPPFFRLLFTPVHPSRSNDEVSVEIEIESVDEYPPKFYSESYSFNATVYLGTPVIKIGRVHASDRDSGPDGRVFYSLRSSSPNSALNKFIIDQSTGIISLNSLSPDDLPPNHCSLIIMASSGRERSLTALAIAQVFVRIADGTEPFANGKDGINTAASSDSSFIGSGILMLIVFLLLVTIILLFVMLAIRLYQAPNGDSILNSNSCTFDMNTLLKKRMASNSTLNAGLSPLDHPSYMSHLNRSGASTHTYVGSIHSVTGSYILPHNIDGPPPPCYSQITNVTTSTNMEGTSASSGRGSVDGDAMDGEEEVDEEIRMIIEGADPYYEPPADAILHVPASEYLARLGVIDHAAQDIPSIPPQTMSDLIEEIDHDDVVSENLGDMTHPRSKNGFSSVRSHRNKHSHRPGRRSRHRNYNSTNTIGEDFLSSKHSNLPDAAILPQSDELIEAYNWNYLSNWQPRYQPLTMVFAEIAKLKGTTVAADQTQAELMMDQEPIQEQSYLSRLETISTLSGSTTNSSCFRRYPPVANNYQLSPKSPTSDSGGPNSLSVSLGSLASSNPLVQASTTSAFSPVGKGKLSDVQLHHRVDEV